MTDFEAALVDPIADVFPETRHQGCWFHYCQLLQLQLLHLSALHSKVSAQFAAMAHILTLLHHAVIAASVKHVLLACEAHQAWCALCAGKMSCCSFQSTIYF